MPANPLTARRPRDAHRSGVVAEVTRQPLRFRFDDECEAVPGVQLAQSVSEPLQHGLDAARRASAEPCLDDDVKWTRAQRTAERTASHISSMSESVSPT